MLREQGDENYTLSTQPQTCSVKNAQDPPTDEELQPRCCWVVKKAIMTTMTKLTKTLIVVVGEVVEVQLIVVAFAAKFQHCDVVEIVGNQRKKFCSRKRRKTNRRC